METRTARLCKNSASQAVRVPAEFRFASDQVYATRDEFTGDVVLSTRSGAGTWEPFFAVLRAIKVPDDFMTERPMNRQPGARGVFDNSE